MKKLLEDAGSFYRPKLRLSGHDISHRFVDDNSGAIPLNLLQIPNTESNSPYQRHYASVDVKPHPASFPGKLLTFFIEFFTDPGDTVLDFFAGSNTTGSSAEKLGRRWMAFEKDCTYLAASAFRFVDELPPAELGTLLSRLHSDALPVQVNRQQRDLALMEKPTTYPTKTNPKCLRWRAQRPVGEHQHGKCDRKEGSDRTRPKRVRGFEGHSDLD